LITNYSKKICITGYKNLFRVKLFGEYKIELTIPNNISTNLINIWFKEALNLEEENISSNKHFVMNSSNSVLLAVSISKLFVTLLFNICLNSSSFQLPSENQKPLISLSL
jgi:hypothetical protein